MNIEEPVMPEEPMIPPYTFYDTSEARHNTQPLTHRDGSIEHEYIVAVSPDLPAVRLRVFTFPNGDAQVEAEFDQ
jgi:hypothetical protein